jgi:CheY-like chemotaxis protein
MAATMTLERIGCAGDAASSGPETLEKVRVRKRPYTVILIDVQMHGTDGLETMRHIRAWETGLRPSR